MNRADVRRRKTLLMNSYLLGPLGFDALVSTHLWFVVHRPQKEDDVLTPCCRLRPTLNFFHPPPLPAMDHMYLPFVWLSPHICCW
jgi:hypothetical protein